MVSRLMFALLFVAWVGEWPPEIDNFMYMGLWRSPFGALSPFFAPLPGIHLFPWQVMLIAMAPLCIAAPGAFRNRAREMDAAILASLLSIGITFMWGWFRGGAPYQAYYQVWRFLTALLLAFLLASVIRTPRDLRFLALTILCAALIRGTLVMYFYWVHVYGKIFPAPDYMTNHDDSLLFVAAILIVLSWAILKGGMKAWVTAGVVVPYLIYAVVLNNRRIAWLELLMGFVAIYVLIGSGPMRRRINRGLIVLAPLVLVYVAAGWGREGAVWAPIHALSSTGSNEDNSSLARQEEARNILYTMSVTGNPVLGTGWGVPYQKLTRIYNNYAADWILALYTPHNSLLGLALFAGLVGVLGIWSVIPVGAYLAARGFRGSTDPYVRAAGMVAVGVLTGYSVHAFGDIGLQSFPCCLFLGVALATAAKVGAWSRVPAPAKTARTPEGARETRVPLPPAPVPLAARLRNARGLGPAAPIATQGIPARRDPVIAHRTRS